MYISFKAFFIKEPLDRTYIEMGFLSSMVKIFEEEKEGDEEIIVYLLICL